MGFAAGWAELDAAWARVGGPGVPRWWAEWVRGWRRRRCEVVRVGRRGGKSSTGLCRCAVVEAVFGDHEVPVGDCGVVAIVSCDRREAVARIKTCGEMLDALGILNGVECDGTHGVTSRKSLAESIELVVHGKPRAIRVFTATVGGVSGFTSICALGDEVCKWRDNDGLANADAVISSLRPTMATQPNAVMMLCSSPWLQGDAHSQLFDRGDTEHQRASYAPSWVANPTLGVCPVCAAGVGHGCDHDVERYESAKQATLALEPDEREWRREYEAIPMDDAASAWFPAGCAVSGRVVSQRGHAVLGRDHRELLDALTSYGTELSRAELNANLDLVRNDIAALREIEASLIRLGAECDPAARPPSK